MSWELSKEKSTPHSSIIHRTFILHLALKKDLDAPWGDFLIKWTSATKTIQGHRHKGDAEVYDSEMYQDEDLDDIDDEYVQIRVGDEVNTVICTNCHEPNSDHADACKRCNHPLLD